jgi:chitodextrinase
MKKIPVIYVIFFLLITTIVFPQINTIPAADDTISWDCIIYCNETSGCIDTVTFGEAADAHDGPPPDNYDVAKPPTPIAPYVRAYLKDNLPSPYTALWKDYRQYPANQKTWNLSIQWAPEDSESPSDITLTWNSLSIETSEYTTMTLCTNTGAFLKDMRLENTYTFSCPAYVIQNFKIIGHRDNTSPETPSTPTGETLGYHGTTYNYETVCSDPDDDSVYYQFDWGDSTLSNWFGPYPSGQTLQTSHLWDAPGVYLIKAHSKDISGQQSPWSGTLSVDMQNRAPTQPASPNPQHQATSVQITPTLTWVGSDPDGDALSYDVYFGTTNPPIKRVDNQSAASFHPETLAYQTTYYWNIIAWDGFGSSMNSPIWSFTTESSSGGVEPSDNETNSTNQAPVADATLSEQAGFVGASLIFNGTRSYDPDGYLTKWSWDFGDGTIGVGERTTHTYQTVGEYTVVLTVTDNDGATGTDTISVQINTGNQPPTTPLLDGQQIGTKNTPYTYTISSSDADNDFIQYHISWGDGTQNTSLFLPNGTAWSISHIWGSSGKHQITVSATDNNTFSEETTLDVFIDVSFINTLGFLYDANNDGIFDSLYINQTGHVTSVKTTDLGTYYLDTDDDGNWDSLYNPSNGSLTPFGSNVTRIENPWFFIGIIVIAILIIGVIVYFYKKHYF